MSVFPACQADALVSLSLRLRLHSTPGFFPFFSSFKRGFHLSLNAADLILFFFLRLFKITCGLLFCCYNFLLLLFLWEIDMGSNFASLLTSCGEYVGIEHELLSFILKMAHAWRKEQFPSPFHQIPKTVRSKAKANTQKQYKDDWVAGFPSRKRWECLFKRSKEQTVTTK